MRSLLLIGLLILSIYCQDPMKHQKLVAVAEMNKIRWKVAQQEQWADMNELVYREDLEQLIVQELAKSNGCPDPSIITRNGYHIVLNYGATFTLPVVTQSGSTVIALEASTCSENGEPVYSLIVDASDTKPVRGEPGTHCPVGRTRNSNGLCAVVGNGRRGYARKSFDPPGGWELWARAGATVLLGPAFG